MSKSVLLLDENPDVLVFLTHLLEARGVRVLRARTTSEASELLERDYVSTDLVLANIMFGQIDESSLPLGVPLIFMTAFVDAGVIRVEALNRVGSVGFSGTDERGVIEAVMSALRHPGARASGM